jgi:hypothetical protein
MLLRLDLHWTAATASESCKRALCCFYWGGAKMSELSNPTPGPWRLHEGTWEPWSGAIGVEGPNQPDDGVLFWSTRGGGNEEANARLIAAAPDQHAVCVEFDRLSLLLESAVRESIGGKAYLADLVKAVVAVIKANRAAIAKATNTPALSSAESEGAERT